MTQHSAEPARELHESTKLSYINLRNKPPLYKSYPDVPTIPLPTGKLGLGASALPAVAGIVEAAEAPFSLDTLSKLLYFSAGVIRKAVLRMAGEVHYRAAASAGALYPIEAYLVCRDLPGLEAGVYHFAPAEFSLRRLRAGDYRAHLANAADDEPALLTSPVTIVFSCLFWRSAWKYRSRGYRYCFWDNGTVAANLMAAASAMGLSSKLLLGFVDQQVDQLIGIDGEHEASTCLVPIGHPDDDSGLASDRFFAAQLPDVSQLPDITGLAATNFADEIVYEDIGRTHAATRLSSQAEVKSWRGGLAPPTPAAGDSLYPLERFNPAAVDAKTLGQVIAARGSTRRFAREAISLAQFSALLECSTRGIAADFLDDEGQSLLDIYLIVNAVAGLASGAYFFSPIQPGLELLQEGDLREEAGHLCFEQALGADAAAVVFIMADLNRILGRFGNRGYRAAQTEAGIVGGKLYLCAYSLGLGASGITFYDNEISEFFLPHSAGRDVMFVVTLGQTAEENRVRPFRSRVAVKLDALARGAGHS